MMKKSNFKKLLATASAMAVLTGGVGTAAAAVVPTAANDAVFTAGTNMNGGTVIGVGDTVTIANGGTHKVGDGGIGGAGITLTGNVASTVELSNTAGAIGVNLNLVKVDGGVNTSITLKDNASVLNMLAAANHYTKLASITGPGKVDFQGANAQYDGTIVNAAEVKVTAGGAVALGGAITANNFIIANNAADVTSDGLITSKVTYDNTGELTSNAGVTGDVDFNNKAGTFNLGNGAKVTGNVKTHTGATGTFVFLGAGEVTGAMGDGTKLTIIQANGAGAVKIGGAVSATNFKINHLNAAVTVGGAIDADVDYTAAGTLNANKGITGNVDFANNDGTLNVADTHKIDGNVDSTGGGDTGKLIFANNGEVTGQIGAANALKMVEAKGAGTVILAAVDHASTAFQVTDAASIMQVKDGGKLSGAVDGAGIVDFVGAGEIDTGLIGAATVLGELKVASGGAAKSVTLANGISKINKITLAGGNATLEIKAGGAGTIGGNAAKDGTIDGAGTVKFLGDGTVHGTIGGTTAVKSVLANGNGTIVAIAYGKDAGGKSVTHNTGLSFGNAGAIITIADGAKIVGDAVGVGAGGGTVTFLGAGEFAGDLGKTNSLTAVIANAANTVTIGKGTHDVTNFKLGNAGAKFTFADGANITGAIDTTAGTGTTEATFLGSSTVSGKLGNAAAVKVLNISGNENSTVKFSEDVSANEVKIGKGTMELDSAAGGKTLTSATSIAFSDADNGVLSFTGGNNATITGGITNALVAGTVVVNTANGDKAEFSGNVGDVASATNVLKLLDIRSNDEAHFKGDAHIQEVKFASKDSKLTLGSAGGADYKFKTITLGQIGAGELNIAEDATIKAAELSFGTEGREMAKVSFAADKTLILEDGVNVWAGSVVGNGANHEGVIEFKGNNTFSAKNTAATDIKAINVNNAGKVAKLMKPTFVNADVTIQNNATLEIADNINAANIQSAVANNGTIRFINQNKNVVVTGNVGGANTLKSIEFAGNGKVEFANKTTHADQTFAFTEDAGVAAEVTFEATTDLSANTFVNKSANTPKVNLVANPVVFGANADLAHTENPIDFVLNAANAATIATLKSKGANFTTTAKDTGVVVLNLDGAAINSVGADNLNIATLTVTKSGTVTSGTYAKTIDVAAAQTATFGGVVKGSDALNLNAADAKVVFLDGATLDHNIKANNAADEGLVEFAGDVTINNEIGATGTRVNTITFVDDAKSTAKLNKDIHAKTVVMRKGVIAPQTNITLDAETVTVASTTFHSGAHSIATSGTMNFSGDNKINLNIDSNFNVGKPSTIAVTNAGGKLEFEANTKFDVKPSDTNSTPNAGETKIVFVAKNESGADIVKLLDLSNVTVDDEDNFTKWTKGFTAKDGFFLSGSNDSKAALERRLADLADPVDKANIAKLSVAKNDTDAGLFRDKVLQTLTKEKTKEALDRIESVTATKAVDAVEGATTHVNNGMSTRMNALTGVQRTGEGSRTVASNDISGINAGDDHARFGAWVSPFYGQAIQKKRKGAAGYKAKSYGASFGFDTRANEDMILGGALTVSNTDLKHRDFKAGDETKISSLMFSIYGMQQITDTWFAQASATFGSSTIKNTEGRTISNSATEQVKGKYNASSFTGEAMFGYNYATEMLTVTPMFGMRYTRVNAGGYKETGSNTNQNLQVSSKASNKFDVVVGARLAGGTFAVDCMTVTPEIHGFIAHDLIGKNANQTAKLEGAEAFTQKSKKPVRTTYNLGLGVNADCGMMEYGAGYDATFADKRVGHQGTLRLRVNF
ncbi:autotransporter outer membrane beta-barrel domain-containing protein [Rickettsiaceae bacterium]|nr:autotransporter outer membrane beta-barrel domain-containing protein [Rickettsiaceae bacterium]